MSNKKFVTMDGNTAAAHVAYAFTEIAAIYPITPSSNMAQHTDVWSAKGRLNMFGQPVSLVEMQSEAGAAAAVHGALQTGALSTTFTSSQGLLLMIPVMHRIAGELLPGVFHVASRTVGTHAMSIFGDHSDVMNCRQTGFAMLSTGSVQEVMDLAGAAHLAAIRSRVPFLHFFDGFRTSHEVCKVEEIDLDALTSLLDKDALRAFRQRALNPEHPLIRSTVQNGDIFFQMREASNRFYDELPAIVEGYMDDIAKLTGRRYHLFDYHGAPDAEHVVVAMGSVSGVIRETVDWLCAQGKKVGFVQVHLFRPFSATHLIKALPSSVRRIAVLDRCHEMGSAGDPLYQDVCTAFTNSGRDILIVGGRYGLSSKDTAPAQIRDVFDELERGKPRNGFSIGIEDDVTFRSLPAGPALDIEAGMISCKLWGLGSDGTVGANKNTVEIINSTTDLYAQAYFEFDAKKSYGITKSHLRFGKDPIRFSCYVRHADIIACHNQTYVGKYDMAEELKPGGAFLLNCEWNADELESRLPASLKRCLAEKDCRLYLIDASRLAREIGLGHHTNIILQASFFRIAQVIPLDEAVRRMEDAVRKTYFSKGEEVVSRNIAAIHAGLDNLKELSVPDHWRRAEDPAPTVRDVPPVVSRLLEPINAQKGDLLPVSTFLGYEDGCMSTGLTAWEKRDIAVYVPKWDEDRCIQCNRCSFVCPHSVIRPLLLDDSEREGSPEGFATVPAKGRSAAGLHYSLQVSVKDCTGCGSCVTCCPVPGKALAMVPRAEAMVRDDHWGFSLTVSVKKDIFDKFTLKGSQFRQPLLEFSAACAGCGETPYAKLLTQLFGTRVYWANATGCSQAWGSPMPGIPYTTDRSGRGPAWSNSLFENNAEFSLGMLLSVRQQRNTQKMRLEKLLAKLDDGDAATSIRNWLSSFDDFETSEDASRKLQEELELLPPSQEVCEILDHRDQLTKKCFWMFGGDGWAYDIGFGGLDHVLASGEDINVFIVDTEVYSNTGGQSSKATQTGAVAQFCSSGKASPKKDLGAIFMSYGNIYVAQVSMGADPQHLMQVLKEASEYPGPSLVIAYAPCIAHGIRAGMDKVQLEMKRATDSGYWPLFRFDPRKEQPFSLDSGSPSMDYLDFLNGETRYAALKRMFPAQAEALFTKACKDAEQRLTRYEALASLTAKKDF